MPQSGPSFLELGERLRQRGQLDAALSVALAGVARYPTLAAAHDLVGRVRADQGDDEGARSAWHAALECHGDHAGALKGLAFLAFRRRDFADAERHLESAATGAPRDASILAALDRVRAARPAAADEPVAFDDPAAGHLLFDQQGLRLAGGLGGGYSEAQADAVAAVAAGAIREVARATRLLDLGAWQHLLVEGEAGRVVVLPVSPTASLVVSRPVTAPVGRLLAFSARAANAARSWLGHQQ